MTSITDIIEACKEIKGTIRFGFNKPISRFDFNEIYSQIRELGIKSKLWVEGNTITFTKI